MFNITKYILHIHSENAMTSMIKLNSFWSGNINKMGKMSVQTTLQSMESGGKLNEIYIIYGKRKCTNTQTSITQTMQIKR